MWASIFAIVVTAIVMVVVVAASLSVACCRRSNAVQDDLEAACGDGTTNFSSTPQVSKPQADVFYGHRHPHVLARDELQESHGNHTSVDDGESDFDSMYFQSPSNDVNVASLEQQNVTIIDNICSSPVEENDQPRCNSLVVNNYTDSGESDSDSEHPTHFCDSDVTSYSNSWGEAYTPSPDAAGSGSRISTDNNCSGIPDHITSYIADFIIPSFKDQRNGNQFAVVLLLSNDDFKSIDKVKLVPSDDDGKPLLDVGQTTIPAVNEYCNYIAARPVLTKSPARRRHSEREIFERRDLYCGSRFDELWRMYGMRYNRQPDHILLYSFFLPCRDCTDIIIKKLRRWNGLYAVTPVYLVHTTFWKKEDSSQRELNRNELVKAGIIVQQVKYDKFIPKQYTH